MARRAKPNTANVDMVDAVTREHGETFATQWWATDSIAEACNATKIMAWPGEGKRCAHGRFLDIEDQIMERVFRELRELIAKTFVRVANEVLASERRKANHV
jgi:hypothetical protein